MSNFLGGNPALTEDRITSTVSEDGATMTIRGAVEKTALLFALMFIPAAFLYSRMISGVNYSEMGEVAFNQTVSAMYPLMIGGFIVGIIAALIGTFNPKASPIAAPIYAIGYGLALGGISAMYGMQFEGIVFQAIMLTLGVLLVMLGLYSGRILQATNKFVKIVMALTFGVFITYMMTWILGMFGINIGFIHEGGLFGIIFSLAVVVIASLNFIIDFDMIEKGEKHGAPKYMEWFGAMGVMITLVWLYLSILRLLAQLQSRD